MLVIDNTARNFLDKKLRPIARLIARKKFSPCWLTWMGFVVSLFASYEVWQQNFIAALILWWTGRVFDSFDGLYARASSQTSAFGGFLDISLDMASYSLFLIGIALSHPELQTYWLFILLGYLLCITTALALGNLEKEFKLAPRDNRGLRLGAGLAEAGETGIFYSFYCLLPEYAHLLASIWIVILFVTIVNRTVLAYLIQPRRQA